MVGSDDDGKVFSYLQRCNCIFDEYNFLMSSWKLVEAEAVVDPFVDQGARNGGRSDQRGRGDNRAGYRRNSKGGDNRRQGGNRGGRRRDDNYSSIYVPDTPESRQAYAALALQTIEYFFSVDSLCSDTYIRSYMDEAGYVPIAFVCNFPDVLAVGAYYEDIVECLSHSALFELDMENETLRLREGWEKWLIPNGHGGFGLPRYIKQAPEVEGDAVPSGGVVEGETFQEQRVRSGSKELSAAATEYVFVPSPQK